MKYENTGSMLRDRVQTENADKRAIKEKVENSAIRPTEQESQIFRKMLEKISDDFRIQISSSGFSGEIVDKIRNTVLAECEALDLDYETTKRVERLVMSNITGLGPIQPYMDDDSITEIVVQRYDNICIERNGLIEKVDAAFVDEEHLQTIINRIVQPLGRQINLSTPMVDARLADGSRVNALIPPVSPDGAQLTIRKFSKRALTAVDYLEKESISKNMLKFLAFCVQGKMSLIVSGGTGSGKTTLLNMLSSFIPDNELIITIEDNCELRLVQPNVRRLEARQTTSRSANLMPVTIQSLVKNALRMRPDRIIVGEIRDGTIVDMMSAMSTGHEGSMSTVHANDPENLVYSRMDILYSQYEGASFSQKAQALQISEALALVVQIQRGRDGKRRITHITHVAGTDESGQVILKDVFIYDQKEKRFRPTGYIPEELLEELEAKGIHVDKKIFVDEKKAEVTHG